MCLVGRDEAALEALGQEIERTTDCVLTAAKVDLSDPQAVVRFAAGVDDVDLLINCAGFSVVGEVKDIPLELYRHNMAVNFLAPVLLTGRLLGRATRPSTVINVLSTTAIAGRRRQASYSATKAALWAYTCILRRTAPVGTRVVEVLPATFASRFAANTVRVGADGTKTTGREAAHLSSGQEARGLTSAVVASKVYDAVEAGKDRVFVPFEAKLFLVLETVAPWLFRRLFK
jgi:short-subunit dehydrogenase